MPDAIEVSDCVFTIHYDEDPPYITVDQYGPHVLISASMLTDLMRGHTSPWVELEQPVTSPPPLASFTGWYGFTGCYFRIHARNIDLVYVIGKYRHDRFAYEASWPD